MKKLLIGVALACSLFVFPLLDGSRKLVVEFEPFQCILQVSQPKSGTHLLQKALDLITGQKETLFPTIGFGQPERFQQTPEQFEMMVTALPRTSTHLMYDESFGEVIQKRQCLILFSTRHPLDLLVSWAHYIEGNKYFPRAKGLTLSDIIDDILDDSYLSYHVTPRNAVYMPPAKGLKQAYEKYLAWMEAPNVLTVKFEDLVGPEGGGDLAAQRHTIQRIAQHVGVSLSHAEIDYVCDNLFGGTNTFRKGQIGLYKHELSPEQLAKGLELMQPIIDILEYDF